MSFFKHLLNKYYMWKVMGYINTECIGLAQKYILRLFLYDIKNVYL